jgi:hypothetical protein
MCNFFKIFCIAAIQQFGLKHGRPETHRNFIAVMIVDLTDLSHQLHHCAVLKRPKILCRQQKTLLSASSRSPLVDGANHSNYNN